MIAFIDAHREVYGVEPICNVLPIAPSTYHAHVARRSDPARAPARVRRDAVLRDEIERVWSENFGVYGVRKVWRQLRREGVEVARCTVARLMREMGLQGVVRGKAAKTTVSDRNASCPLDRVNRQFQVTAPNRLWVSDFTEVIHRRGPWRSLEPRHSNGSTGSTPAASSTDWKHRARLGRGAPLPRTRRRRHGRVGLKPTSLRQTRGGSDRALGIHLLHLSRGTSFYLEPPRRPCGRIE